MNKTPLPTVTNAEDWIQSVAVTDEEGGFDLSTYTISIRVTDKNGTEVLTGSTSDGKIALSEDEDEVESVFTWTFRASAMSGLQAGSYTVAVRITDGTNTNQVILGVLSLVDGGFSS